MVRQDTWLKRVITEPWQGRFSDYSMHLNRHARWETWASRSSSKNSPRKCRWKQSLVYMIIYRLGWQEKQTFTHQDQWHPKGCGTCETKDLDCSTFDVGALNCASGGEPC